MEFKKHTWANGTGDTMTEDTCTVCGVLKTNVLLSVGLMNYPTDCSFRAPPPPPPPTAEQIRWVELSESVLCGRGEYLCLGSKKSTLDGRFTAVELRKIADVMDIAKAEGLRNGDDEWEDE